MTVYHHSFASSQTSHYPHLTACLQGGGKGLWQHPGGACGAAGKSAHDQSRHGLHLCRLPLRSCCCRATALRA